MTAISWTSTGIPAPQGSKRHVGRGIMIEANKALPAWREQVVYDVINAAGGHVFTEGVSINLAFQFPRLKAHFNSKGLLKPKAPTFKTTKPDIDKLCRAILDAITIAGAIRDDSQCYALVAIKTYCDEGQYPGVSGTISDLL
tara:strand:- start:572 stop:997 length:426 start_codon:yes stop_codon:yes gene_type:complete